MPRALTLCLALFAVSAFAQQRIPARPGGTLSGFLASMVDRLDAEVRGKSAAVRRDAFIVSQIVAAVGELDDFQRAVALDKARDRVEVAIRRAAENPVAPRATLELLQSQRDLIKKAKEQGATADVPALKREMMKSNHFMQQTLFNELDDLRKDRQTLSDLQARLSSMTNDMDNALAEALGSTFDYFRAVGND